MNMRMVDLKEWPLVAIKVWATNHLKISTSTFNEVINESKEVMIDHLIKAHISSAHKDIIKEENRKKDKTKGFKIGGIEVGSHAELARDGIIRDTQSNSASNYTMSGNIKSGRIGMWGGLVSINFGASEFNGYAIRCNTYESFNLFDFPPHAIIKIAGNPTFIVADPNDPLDPPVATSILAIVSPNIEGSYVEFPVYDYTDDLHNEIKEIELTNNEVAIEDQNRWLDTLPPPNPHTEVGYITGVVAPNYNIYMDEAVNYADFTNSENIVVQSLTQESESAEIDEEEVSEE